MRPEPPRVIGEVITMFVVVRHHEVVIDEQTVRDKQVVGLVSNRRELLPGMDRNTGDERERARDAWCEPWVEDETNTTRTNLTQQLWQHVQGDCSPGEPDE